MQAFTWIVLLAIAAAVAYSLWRARARWLERQRGAEERLAAFTAQAVPRAPLAATPAPRKDAGTLPQQKLLLDAAAKAAEAGEPVLSIQLYARLLARYPDSGFAGQARAAVEVQKKKLAKG